MLKKSITIPFVLLFLISFSLSVSVVQSTSLKERMAARIPAINTLKDQGVVGENNKGFLEFRGNKQPQKDIVDAENTSGLSGPETAVPMPYIITSLNRFLEKPFYPSF